MVNNCISARLKQEASLYKRLVWLEKTENKRLSSGVRVSPVCLPVSPLPGHPGPHTVGHITTAWEYRHRCSCASYTSSSTHLAQVRKEVVCFDCPQRFCKL